MKTFLALAWWRRSADEKIPLSSKNVISDNGAIPKLDVPNEVAEKREKENMASSKPDNSKTYSPEKLVNGQADDSDFSGSTKNQPMSLLRKFAMFLSLDIIALYFLAFAWLIPCRILQCNLGKEWTVNLDNVSISTNLEVGGPLRSEVLLFGYSAGNVGDSDGVTALESSTGSVKWQVPVDFGLVRSDCKVVDVNRDGVLDCLVFGSAHLLALNASDGHIFWTQGFKQISLLIAAVSDCEKEGATWIAVVVNKGHLREYVKHRNLKEQINIVILDGKNGSVVRDLPLPCDSYPKQLVAWKSKKNVTQITFQCSYDGKTEVKIISEEELCSLIKGRRVLNTRDFSVLFSFGSSTAVDDVFLHPLSHMGLLVGWSTVVAMATDARNPPRLLWQTMSGSIRSVIKFISEGYFTSKNSMQIAIVMQHGGYSNVVEVVNFPSGKEVGSVDIGSGRVTSTAPVFQKTGNVDSLLIKLEGSSGATPNSTAADIIDFATESTMLRQAVTYLLLTADKDNNVTELLTENRRTEVTVLHANCTTLFIATLTSNRRTRISSRALSCS